MHIFDEQDIQWERLWLGPDEGTKLVVRHLPSGLSAEHIIGFEDEGPHRRKLHTELSHKFEQMYPASDFILDHIWCGPGKGTSLRLSHRPTGITVDRNVGPEAQAKHQHELLQELFTRLKWHEISKQT